MKLAVVVLAVLACTGHVMSKSVNNNLLEELKRVLTKELRETKHIADNIPDEKITVKYDRVYKRKRDETTVGENSATIKGLGTVVVGTDPLEQSQAGVDQNPYADKYDGMTKEEYMRVSNTVKLINQIDEMKAGVKVTDSERTTHIGDMQLTQADANEMVQDAVTGGNRKRKMSDVSTAKWPDNHVPYIIEYSVFESDEVDNILRALQLWQDSTCLSFSEGAPLTGGYLWFNADKDGCFATLGHAGKKQTVNLGSGCRGVGTILHEVAHGLGSWHEQMRPGRDAYINFLEDNVEPSSISNFQKVDSAFTYSVDYDYGSIMHYGGGSFSKDSSLLSMKTLNPLYQNIIGQRTGLSFFDKLIMNKHYGCIPDCQSLQCMNNGFVNPRSDCTKCICPEGFGGDHCETSGPHTHGCTPINGELVATSTEECVNSPNYPNSYVNDDTCNWIITASDSTKRIEWSFGGDKFFLTYSGGASETCYHWVEIKDGANMTTRGMRFCGASKPSTIRTSQTNQIVVSFNGEYGATHQGVGFKLCYKETSNAASSGNEISGGNYQNPCESGPCQNSGVCSRVSNTKYVCECSIQFTGENCETDAVLGCDAQPCKNAGECVSITSTRYYCKCPEKYTGDHCEEVDTKSPCEATPCQYDGQCNTYISTKYSCPYHGVCTPTRSYSYNCWCKGGYTGDHCETPPSPGCEANPCLNDGKCTDFTAGVYYCSCQQGWIGALCQTVDTTDLCSSSPCNRNCYSYRYSTQFSCPASGACTPTSSYTYQCY